MITLAQCNSGISRAVDGRQPSLYPTPISKPLPGPGDPKLLALVAYSPAGKIAVPVTADTVQLYKADTAQPLGRPIMPGGPVTAIAFIPDGSQVATGDANGAVRLWMPAPARLSAPQ